MLGKTSLSCKTPSLYCLDGVEPFSGMSIPTGTSTLLVSPFFYDFASAVGAELDSPFLLLGGMGKNKPGKTVLFVSYSSENAKYYKGYLQDLVKDLEKIYSHSKCLLVPYATCGAPLMGSVLAIIGADEPITVKPPAKVVFPSECFPDLLSHLLANRRDFPVFSSASFLGAVRSDLHLLPPLSMWRGVPPLCEYRSGNSTVMERLRPQDVTTLFGMPPSKVLPSLALLVPAAVILHFAS